MMKENINDYPKIGAVVIARNEAENIHDTLDALFKQTIPLRQIIFVDDNSDDVRFYTCRAIEAPMF